MGCGNCDKNLIQQIKDLKSELAQAKQDLEFYGIHTLKDFGFDLDCGSWENGPDTCDCGLDDALKTKEK